MWRSLLPIWTGVLLESSSEVYQGVADGRFTVGLTFEEVRHTMWRKVSPVKIVYMEEGVISGLMWWQL